MTNFQEQKWGEALKKGREIRHGEAETTLRLLSDRSCEKCSYTLCYTQNLRKPMTIKSLRRSPLLAFFYRKQVKFHFSLNILCIFSLPIRKTSAITCFKTLNLLVHREQCNSRQHCYFNISSSMQAFVESKETFIIIV